MEFFFRDNGDDCQLITITFWVPDEENRTSRFWGIDTASKKNNRKVFIALSRTSSGLSKRNTEARQTTSECNVILFCCRKQPRSWRRWCVCDRARAHFSSHTQFFDLYILHVHYSHLSMWHTRSSYFHLLYSVTVNSITIFRFYCSNLVFMVKKRRKKRSQSLCDTLAAFPFLWSMRSLVLTYRIPCPERYECGLSMEINKSKNRRKLGHRSIEISRKRNIFSIFETKKNPCTIRRYW